MEQVTETISIVDTEALGESCAVAAYLVKGKEVALIDMGFRSSAEHVVRELSECGIGEGGLDYLLPTHVHLDHAGSCGTLARRFPKASILAHPRGEPHLVNPTRLVKGAGEIFPENLMKQYGTPDPIAQKRVHDIRDDEHIALGNRTTLRAIWTPGHAPHHISYFLESAKVLFTGDAVGVYRPGFPVLIPTTPPPSFNFEFALQSLERLLSLKPVLLLTPHFGALPNASEMLRDNLTAMMKWKETVQGLLASKATVEDIVEALTSDVTAKIGCASPDLPDSMRTTIRVSAMGLLSYLSKSSQQ